MNAIASLQATLRKWLSANPDDDVLRWLYRLLVAAALTTLVLDYGDFQTAVLEKTAQLPSTGQPSAEPLPSMPGTEDRRSPPSPRELGARVREPMTFDLAADGKLFAIGTIVAGTANAFAAEVARRGSYVKTVVMQSPGGSVHDAIAIGRMIRENKFATEVEENRYCASSCPLMFAGGVERRAGRNAAIGVHQVASMGDELLTPRAGMEDGQKISALCQKYLRDMGVDLRVWVHAMETPRNKLYYFNENELLELKLATHADAGRREKRAAIRTPYKTEPKSIDR